MSRFLTRMSFALLIAGLCSVNLYAEEAVSGSIPRMKKDLFFLAGEECEGRGLRTNGINKAADHIVGVFKEAGLKPAFADGYFQPFKMTETQLLEGPNTLALTGPSDLKLELERNKQFTVSGLSAKGKTSGELVFVGYGIHYKKYDEYEGIDVKNKIVVILRNTPRDGSKEPLIPAGESRQYAALATKIALAVKHEAAAVLFVNAREQAGKEDPLMPFDYAKGDSSERKIPVFHIRREILDKMLASQNKTVSAIETDIDRDLKPQSIALTGWKASLETAIGKVDLAVKNIVGVLEGAGPLANETVVFGAHYDHLGRGEPGTKAPGETAIHYGADDNGSGTTGLLELARRFGAIKNREGRRIVFISFTGEERGLHGSRHYCEKPAFPLKDTVAMLNLDMIGRVRPDKKTGKDDILVGGVGSAKNFESLIDTVNKKYDYNIRKSKSGTGPSDHTSFYMAGVPVYFFFSGEHPEYHTPKDVPSTINFEGMNKLLNMVEELGTTIISAKERPEYVKGMGGNMVSGSGDGPKLGVVPHYDDSETTGLVLDGVVPGGAADLAGIKKGDKITSIGGKPVKNIGDYMQSMSTQKRGVEVIITVDREGKKLDLKAVPK